MQARDVMTTRVITVGPDCDVQEIARRLLENRVSAVPVVEPGGRLVGIVSEGDLMRRTESGTERLPSWWLFLLAAPEETARDYMKSHGRRATDVMTHRVIAVNEDTAIQEIAETLEKHRIKRVPVMRGDQIVGVVSRANLVRGLAAQQTAPMAVADDRAIKASVDKAIAEAGVRTTFLNVIVSGGVVTLWGAAESPEEREAVRIAAETAAGVKEIRQNIGVIPPSARAVMWAE